MYAQRGHHAHNQCCRMNAFDPAIFAQLLVYGLTSGATIALSALGITVVFNMVRILNLASGDVFALSTVLSTVIVLELGIQPDSPPLLLYGGLLLSMLGGLAMGVLLNVLVERLAFRPFSATSRLAPLIATFGISFILYQLSLLWRVTLPSWVAGEHRSVPGVPEVPIDGIPELWPSRNLASLFGFGDVFVVESRALLLWLIALGAGLALSGMFRFTRFGLEMRAVAQNRELARMCGVPVERTVTRAFALGGLLAGAAAFVFVMHYARPFGQHGAQSGLIAFSAAVLGGVGSPMGAVFGGFVFGVAQSLSDFYLSTVWTPVLVYSVVIALLVLRPEGVAVGRHADDRATESERRDEVTAFMRASKNRWSGWVWSLPLALAVAYPAVAPLFGGALQSVFTAILIYAVLAIGLTVMLGYAGLLDLGYAISFGIGGYTAALLTDPYGKLYAWLGMQGQIDFLVLLAIAAAVAGLFGVLNAALTFRMRPDYLAIVTLAYGLIVRQLALVFSDVTGGTQGISVLPVPMIAGIALKDVNARYYLALALTAVIAVCAQRLLHSRAGRAFMAMGEDEVAAASSGINVNRYKGAAFIIGTAVAGVAGALYASSFGLVEPDMGDFRISMMVLAMVIVSGAGGVPGAVIGAIAISLYDRLAVPAIGDFLSRQTNGAIDIRQLSYLMFGLAVYLTVFFRARNRGAVR